MQDHERSRLLNRLIDGSIGSEDFTRLQNLMRHDAGLRQEYYDLLAVDQLLIEAYEVPDYIAVHAQTMDNTWAVRRVRRGMMTRSLLAAAAVLVFSLAAFLFVRARQPEIRLSGSSDSHYVVNGSVSEKSSLEVGEIVDLKHGVLSLALGPFVEACFEAPASLRVRDRDGTVELTRGSAFFQMAPGSEGFEVHTPAGVIRDIGTRFGVRVSANGQVETHVLSGIVDIRRPGGDPVHRVIAGEAVTWTLHGPISTRRLDANAFVQSLPIETPLLVDDFNEPDGTAVKGKAPDVGRPWQVPLERGVSVIRGGALDTSSGPRTFQARFRETFPDQRNVVVITLNTCTPARIYDKDDKHDAAESVTLLDVDEKEVFSLVARASRDHTWQIRDNRSGRLSRGTRVSALSDHTLTLSYEQETGMVRLFDGPSTQANLLDEFQVTAGAVLGAFAISNSEGGDVALSSLSVRGVRYPK